MEIKFCGFNLQVAMEEWKLVDEASGATTAAPVSFGDHKSVEKIASERTNFATVCLSIQKVHVFSVRLETDFIASLVLHGSCRLIRRNPLSRLKQYLWPIRAY